MAKGGGLCVANHTSPIDAILLACDRNYALVCILHLLLNFNLSSLGNFDGAYPSLISKIKIKHVHPFNVVITFGVDPKLVSLKDLTLYRQIKCGLHRSQL